MPAPVLQIKRGAAANIGIASLRAGEPGFTTDKYDFYIGLDATSANQKFFGSSRYWKREDATNSAQLKLVDKDGTNFIAIAASDTLAGVATYRFPNTTNGNTGDFLKVKSVAGGYYDLEWSAVPSGSFTITGDTGSDNFTTGQTLTFAGTANEIETSITDNQVQIGLPTNVTVSGILTATTFSGSLSGTATTAIRATSIDVVGVATNQNYYITLVDGSGNAKSVGVDSELLYNPNTNTLTVGTGVGITQFSSSVSTGTSTSSVPTSSAVINYVTSQVNAVDVTLGLNADTGGPSTVSTAQTLTINGTANEIETSVSGQTITVGLPNVVVVGTSLSAPTIETATIESSGGTTAITLSGANVTVAGDLFVNGSTTQVNTTTLNVKDSLIDLGLIDTGGGVLGAPTSDTNKDIGLLLNYYTSSAKKAAVFWDDSAGRIVFADDVSESSSVITVASNAYASIEIESLWVNDCAGQSQVISCTGTERFLQNITVDAGTF